MYLILKHCFSLVAGRWLVCLFKLNATKVKQERTAVSGSNLKSGERMSHRYSTGCFIAVNFVVQQKLF